MDLARIICFAVLTLASPWIGTIAQAAEDAAAAPATAMPTAPAAHAAPASECGPTGVYVPALNACVQIAGSTVWQVNLKTADTSQMGVLLGVAIIHQDSLKLGGAFECGAGLAIHGANAGQCDLLFVMRFATIGLGTEVFQTAGHVVYQGLFSVGLALPGVQ
jgi:hypothetical protein